MNPIVEEHTDTIERTNVIDPRSSTMEQHSDNMDEQNAVYWRTGAGIPRLVPAYPRPQFRFAGKGWEERIRAVGEPTRVPRLQARYSGASQAGAGSGAT